MPRRSAGILLWKREAGGLRVLLVHPGGPFWKNKDSGAWSIPKGEYEDGDDPLATAKRELQEELGPAIAVAAIADRAFVPLGEVRQKGGKQVTAFALKGDADVTRVVSNTFEMEWPPRSGHRQSFPEIDRAAWFSVSEARTKILPGQLELLNRLETLVL